MGWGEHRGFLGQWNYSAWCRNGGYMSLHFCLNPRNVQHHERWALGEMSCRFIRCHKWTTWWGCWQRGRLWVSGKSLCLASYFTVNLKLLQKRKSSLNIRDNVIIELALSTSINNSWVGASLEGDCNVAFPPHKPTSSCLDSSRNSEHMIKFVAWLVPTLPCTSYNGQFTGVLSSQHSLLTQLRFFKKISWELQRSHRH